MDSLDPPNTRRSLLHLARPSKLTPHCGLCHDPLLCRSPSCMRSHLWHHPLHLPAIPRHHIRPHWSGWELRVWADPTSVLLKLGILNCDRAVSDGGNDRVLHTSSDFGTLPSVGEHVPSAFKRCCEIDGRVLLRS